MERLVLSLYNTGNSSRRKGNFDGRIGMAVVITQFFCQSEGGSAVSIPAGIQFPLQAFQDKSGATDAGKSPATVFFVCVDLNFNTGIVPGIERGSR